MLLSRIFDKRYGKVVIIGDGVVGRHSAGVAIAMGAAVYLVGRHRDRVAELQTEISRDIHFVLSEADHIASELHDADLVVGAVLRRGARAPHVVTEAMVKTMQTGSVIRQPSSISPFNICARSLYDRCLRRPVQCSSLFPVPE